MKHSLIVIWMMSALVFIGLGCGDPTSCSEIARNTFERDTAVCEFNHKDDQERRDQCIREANTELERNLEKCDGNGNDDPYDPGL